MYSDTQTHPAGAIIGVTRETDVVLDVRLRLRLSAQHLHGLDLPALGDVHVDGADHDLAAALLGGALHHLTEPSPPPNPPTGVFRREGEYWRIAHGGSSCLLKDMKGLRHLASNCDRRLCRTWVWASQHNTSRSGASHALA